MAPNALSSSALVRGPAQISSNRSRWHRSAFQGDDDLVFCHPQTGAPYDASRLRKRFKQAITAAKVRDIRFHDLRHTFGTQMAASGTPLRALMEWMGHRDFATTLVYADYDGASPQASAKGVGGRRHPLRAGGPAMTPSFERRDPRVDAFIEALPEWQQDICREVREVVHAADPEVEETIKRTTQPYFVLEGNICALLAARDHVNVFLYDGGIVPDPEGIITGGHGNKTARTISIHERETLNTKALQAMFEQIIANNRAGGWRQLKPQD